MILYPQNKTVLLSLQSCFFQNAARVAEAAEGVLQALQKSARKKLHQDAL